MGCLQILRSQLVWAILISVAGDGSGPGDRRLFGLEGFSCLGLEGDGN